MGPDGLEITCSVQCKVFCHFTIRCIFCHRTCIPAEASTAIFIEPSGRQPMSLPRDRSQIHSDVPGGRIALFPGNHSESVRLLAVDLVRPCVSLVSITGMPADAKARATIDNHHSIKPMKQSKNIFRLSEIPNVKIICRC